MFESVDMWTLIILGIGAALYYLRKFHQGPQYENDGIIIPGKVVIVTGCNSGIGKEVVTELAKRSAIVYMACRDTNKCEKTRLEIIKKTGNTNLFNRSLDLASMASIRAFVDGFEPKKLDILINNAAIMHCPKTKTVDGFELQLATNYLGHFLLTMLLLDKLKLGAPSRILNLTCNSYVWGFISRFDIMHERDYSSIKVYAQSKLAIMLFTIRLAKLIHGTGVMVCTVNPGQVFGTELYRHQPILRFFMSPMNLFLRTPKSGSQTIIAAAVDPKFKTSNGKYFENCTISKPYSHSLDMDDAEWLFNHSKKLTNLLE